MWRRRALKLGRHLYPIIFERSGVLGAAHHGPQDWSARLPLAFKWVVLGKSEAMSGRRLWVYWPAHAWHADVFIDRRPLPKGRRRKAALVDDWPLVLAGYSVAGATGLILHHVGRFLWGLL